MSVLSRRDLFKTMPLAAAPLVFGQIAEIPKVGDSPQLFVDFDQVESTENVERVFHAAEKHPANPVLRREKVWEIDRGTWGSIIYDNEERTFKAWYGGTSGRDVSGCSGPDCRSNSVLCYAVSADGIHWDRPKLGLHEVAGTRENNVVIDDDYRDGMAHWESVGKDPFETDDRRRYKALGWSSQDWNGPMSGIFTMTSPDGLRWTHTPEPVFRYHPRPGTSDLGPVGDAQAMMIDTIRRRYVAYLRRLPHRVMSVSTDFVHWTPPVLSLEASDGELSNTIYNHVGFVYGDRYLGFLTYFRRDLRDPTLTVRLITSRDGDHWRRPETGQPLIGPGAIGDGDRFTNMLTGAPPIRRGDRLYIYYRALANRHRPYEGSDSGLKGGGICLATLRVDGFASVGAGYDGGQLTTRPFLFEGTKLQINAKADYGQVAVEVLEGRTPIQGFTQEECRPARADGLAQDIGWKNAALASLRGKPVRLRFHFVNARLYSYRITA
ncbi:MAG: hypothetical protein ABI822_17365 [Bryobacteraceae bacterium]